MVQFRLIVQWFWEKATFNKGEDELLNLYGEEMNVNNDEHIVLEGDLSSVIPDSQG